MCDIFSQRVNTLLSKSSKCPTFHTLNVCILVLCLLIFSAILSLQFSNPIIFRMAERRALTECQANVTRKIANRKL